MFSKEENVIVIDPSQALACFRHEIRYRIAEAYFSAESPIQLSEEGGKTSNLFPFRANGMFFVGDAMRPVMAGRCFNKKPNVVRCVIAQADRQSNVTRISFNGGAEKEIEKLDYNSEGMHFHPSPFFDPPEEWFRRTERTFVYKYRTLFNKRGLCKWTRQAIEDGSLYFPRVSELNDPFDFSYSSGFFRSYYVPMSDSFKDFRDSFGVLSTSKKNDDILMWSHYGDGHKGICLGYYLSNVISKIISAFSGTLFAGSVTYSSTKPSGYFLRWLRLFSSPAFCIETYLMLCLFTKYGEWSYEEEYRLALLPFISAENAWRTLKQKPDSLFFGCSSNYREAIKRLRPGPLFGFQKG